MNDKLGRYRSITPLAHNTEKGEQDNGFLYDGVEDTTTGLEDQGSGASTVADGPTTPEIKPKPSQEENPLNPLEDIVKQPTDITQTYNPTGQDVNYGLGLGPNSGDQVQDSISDFQNVYGKGSAFMKKGTIDFASLKKGALRKELGIPEGKKIPLKDLQNKEGDSKLTLKRKNFARNARKFNT
mgnify:CR=1 FL=1|tara:strand:+ start:141 stop:689 length:549 start_codon:yes stop_codon:yes gene_type:complete